MREKFLSNSSVMGCREREGWREGEGGRRQGEGERKAG
jgi:hypothetical protein